MSVGEALVHGLLGGTAAASEHYVTDWRDRVKRARDKTALEEQREHDAKVRKEEWAQRDKEAKQERDFRSRERLGGETFQARENQLTREQQTSERLGTQEYTTAERDQDVTRKAMIYEDTLLIDKKYREPNTQYTWNAKKTQLIPVKPGKTAFGPPVAEIDKEGKFSWLTSGTSKKGLLGRSGSGSGGSDSSGYEDIKTPSGGPLGGESVTTIYTDADGKEWEHIRDPMGNLIRVPLTTYQERPVVVTPEQQAEAMKFAQGTVDDIARLPEFLGFLTDPKDFAAWGGSRTAAEEYFRRNQLQGHAFDETGGLRLPGTNTATPPTTQPAATTPQQAPAQKPVVQTNDRTAEITTLYQSLNPNQHKALELAAKALKADNNPDYVNKIRQRLIDQGLFSKEQFNLLFGL